jgi:hypothetical protein
LSFPQSVVLCGVRDVRDYRIYSSEGREMITGGSAFNIKAESLRMGDFNQTEVEKLYQQHTEETGQIFEPAALGLAWELTQGQPWLVNALAYEVTARLAHMIQSNNVRSGIGHQQINDEQRSFLNQPFASFFRVC